MKLQFLYSKIKEKEKLIDIRKEYQWFIDNNFPIILPRFYDEIYQQHKNDKEFEKKLSQKLNKVYDEKNYQLKRKEIENSWSKIEEDFFNVFNDLNFPMKDKYICYLSLYGPQGQYKSPNIINIRIATQNDLFESCETIAHELIHLIVDPKIKNLNYELNEGITDLFFKKTKLKTLFPEYRLQSIAKHDERIFNKLLIDLKK